MYRLFYLVLLMPFYCIVMMDGFTNSSMTVFGIFLYLLIVNSCLVFKPKVNKFDVFLYCVNCLMLFPFGFFLYIEDMSFILFCILCLVIISLFFTMFFFEINREIIHLVLVIFTLIFGVNSLYINVKLNEVISFVFFSILHFLCFPNSKKYKFIKFIKKSSVRKGHNN